jgi:uncharacterized protein
MHSKTSIINPALLSLITSQFKLPPDSIHGLSHWEHVETLGLYLASFTHANVSVVSYFAYLHDSQRIREDEDPGHGNRAVVYCKKLMENGLLNLSLANLDQLLSACEIHSDNRAKPIDSTIATCLDSDRLDLIRLGIAPLTHFLLTDQAKIIALHGVVSTNSIRHEFVTD